MKSLKEQLLDIKQSLQNAQLAVAQSLDQLNNPPAVLLNPLTEFTEREQNWFALGEPLDTKRLYVKVVGKGQNPKFKGGIIKYIHPSTGHEVPPVSDYWVSPNKYGITLWDELDVGTEYFIRTEKHQLGSKQLWIWVAYKPFDVTKDKVPAPVSVWNDNWDSNYFTR